MFSLPHHILGTITWPDCGVSYRLGGVVCLRQNQRRLQGLITTIWVVTMLSMKT